MIGLETDLLHVLTFFHQQVVPLQTHRSVSGSSGVELGDGLEGLEERGREALDLRSETV